MAHAFTSRRQATVLIASALAWPIAARSSGFGGVHLMLDPASRFHRKSDNYVPPAQLSDVAEIYKRMSVPIRVNGEGPFGFIVDTGANQSVVSRELAAQLGLTVGAQAPLNGVAGIQLAPTTRASLSIGKRIVENASLSILPEKGIGAPGLLGLDSVGDAALTLDFAKQSLRIDDRDHDWRDPLAVRLKAQKRDGQLTLVDADLAGVPLVAFLDSGAGNTIGNMALRNLAVTRNPKSIWTQTPILSTTGQTIMAEMADLPALRVGGLKMPSWPVAFADLHTFKMWNLTDRPAILIGVDVLSRFQSVCLDFSRSEVRFLLPDSV